MDNKRKFELSFANVLCCLAVIFIHVNSEAVTVLDKSSPWYALIYILWQSASFVVYGFVFLSGIKQFLSVSKNGFNAVSFYRKRLLAILVPYLLWVAAYYAYDCFMHIESFDLNKLVYYMYSGDYIGHFYFVILIVQFYALMPLWVKIFKKIRPEFMITLSLVVMIVFGQNFVGTVKVLYPEFNFRFADRIFTTYLFYWTAGAYIGINYSKALKLFKESKKSVIIIFVFVAVFALFSAYFGSVTKNYSPCIDSIMMLYRITAVVFVFSLSIGRASNVCRFNWFKILDESSYNIYLSHCLVLKIVNQMFLDYGVTNLKIRYAIRFFAVYVISIGLCMLYTYIKKFILKKEIY